MTQYHSLAVIAELRNLAKET